MSAPDRDEEFEAFLKRRTLLPDLPEMLGKLEPPAELDERVINEARTAIHAQRQPVRSSRWARPVALAATILLCLSIVLNVTLNPNRPAARRERATVASAEKTAGQMPAPPPPAAAPATPAPPAAPATTNAPAAPAPMAPSSNALQGEPTAARALAAPPRAPASQMRSGSVAGAPAYSADANSADAITKPATPPLMARSGGNSALLPPPSLAVENPERSAPAAAPAPSDAPGGAGSTHPAQAQLRDETSLKPSEPTSAAAGSLLAAKPTALAKHKLDAPASHPQDPKAWLQQIEALRAQGKTAQADAEMQRFRAAFPDYPAQAGDSGTR